MQTNILEYLEGSARISPDKTAFESIHSKLTFAQTLRLSKSLGTYLATAGHEGTALKGPVLIYLKKSPGCLAAFFGALYSGNPYVPADTEMPPARLSLIRDSLRPVAVITDAEHEDRARELFAESRSEGTVILTLEEGGKREIDEALLSGIRRASLDTDPAYILYTSGSTGVPKGVVVSHRSLIDYMESFCPEIGVRDTDVIASQAPFYFDASLIDIYCTLKMGATLQIVPIELFSQPLRLLEFLQEKRVTMIRWVPSALGIVSTFRGLDSLTPDALRLIIFGAESMPMKCFNYWYSKYPDANFVQIYGPTEITGVCTYHFVKGDVSGEKILPIGRAFRNSGVFLLDDEDRLIDESRPGEQGEVCVRGTCLACGYYNDPERTAAVFVQNPLNSTYPERIYRTGDMASYNEKGELVFASRRDFQIKHMGHRIELGEIEAAAAALAGIQSAVCFFDEKRNRIHMAYTGEISEDKDVLEGLSERLPRYMIPNVLHRLDAIPMTGTGKSDRVKLKEMFLGGSR